MVRCGECEKEVSSDAVRCPHCGKKLKMGFFGKAVLSVVAVVGLFIAWGATIPENEAKANSVRRLCEREMMPKGAATQYDCDKAYDNAKAGR